MVIESEVGGNAWVGGTHYDALRIQLNLLRIVLRFSLKFILCRE